MNGNQLNGKVAVVTGASKGLGKAMALALAAAGAVSRSRTWSCSQSIRVSDQ